MKTILPAAFISGCMAAAVVLAGCSSRGEAGNTTLANNTIEQLHDANEIAMLKAENERLAQHVSLLQRDSTDADAMLQRINTTLQNVSELAWDASEQLIRIKHHSATSDENLNRALDDVVAIQNEIGE